jgi:PAS domain S-box-containing protein
MSIKEKNGIKEILFSNKYILKKKNNQPISAFSSAEIKSIFLNNKKQEAEIKNLKEQLSAKEEQLKNHLNALDTTNASIEFDIEGNILSVNKNFLKIMGYSKKDLIGKHHSLLVDQAYSNSNAYQLFWDSLKKGIYQKNEFTMASKNGKTIWLSGSYNPILDALGMPYKILKIATDITLSKIQFLQLAVQAQEKEKRAAELIIANKELKFQNQQKEKRAAELIIANKKLASENILKEKRKIEKLKRAAELIVTNQELAYQEKRSSELTLANDELIQAQQELGSFSYSVSHDLRAPIRAINGYTQILIEDHTDSIDDDGKKILQGIINNSNKMGRLIDDLLAFSKLGRKEVSSTNINMTALVNGLISEITIEKGDNIPIFEIEDLASANGDPSLIKQVWVNLISNAIKYSKYKPETRIKITSTIKKDTIIYSIRDWGAGFDMAYYDKLFGVFQRLHSQEEFAGTGIGLAIVQKIVNRHYGKVWAKSKLQSGTNFYFSLPNIKLK